MAQVVAIVVARGGSRRLPGKALLPFGDTTLIGHKVRQLYRCQGIQRVAVGSDCDQILAEAARANAQVVKRDDFHCDESRCTANEMIADMVRRVYGDVIVWAHPTNPLVKPQTYDAAIAAYFAAAAAGTADSLLSVTRIQRHAWVDGRPFNFDPTAARHAPAAELAPILLQDGAIFIQPREQMLANRYFYGRRPLTFEVPWSEGWDIDTREEYEWACSTIPSPITASS